MLCLAFSVSNATVIVSGGAHFTVMEGDLGPGWHRNAYVSTRVPFSSGEFGMTIGSLVALTAEDLYLTINEGVIAPFGIEFDLDAATFEINKTLGEWHIGAGGFPHGSGYISINRKMGDVDVNMNFELGSLDTDVCIDNEEYGGVCFGSGDSGWDAYIMLLNNVRLEVDSGGGAGLEWQQNNIDVVLRTESDNHVGLTFNYQHTDSIGTEFTYNTDRDMSLTTYVSFDEITLFE